MIGWGTDMDRKPGSSPPRDTPDRREGLGRAIQSLRAERGLKRRKLAERAGLSYAYLAEIENGKKEPSTRILDAIAQALGIRLPELMEVAESLQEMANTTLAPASSAEPAEPREKSPMMAERLSESRSWFHRPSEPVQYLRSPRGLKPTARTDSEAPSRSEILEELVQLASRLQPQDLERLLDLARRFGKQSGN